MTFAHIQSGPKVIRDVDKDSGSRGHGPGPSILREGQVLRCPQVMDEGPESLVLGMVQGQGPVPSVIYQR